MGILLAILAGAFLPLTSIAVKKSVDVGGTAKAFFVFQMLSSFLLAVLWGPVRNGDFTIPLPTAIIGSSAGVILAVMLFSLGKAVEKGPPGLTFAILNSATVMPGLLMALLFGGALGFEYNFWHGMGSFLVIMGLFLGAKGLTGMKEMKSWLFFVMVMFTFHFLLLALYQWRGMLTNHPEASPYGTPQELISEWFAAFMFLACGLIQLSIYLRAGKRWPKSGEIFYGIAGGISNWLCTFFLLWAAQVASPLENAVIFPVYSVIAIILTNMWGQRFYHEEVNWRACQLCVFGLFVGTVNWKAVAAAIGF